LRDAFFRFDQAGDSDKSHVRRRRTLGVALDLVQGAKGALEWSMIRPALYLGEYEKGHSYISSKHLQDWAARWKMVEIRHHYSFGLQCLFAAFLQHVSGQEAGISFQEYMDWVGTQLPTGVLEGPAGAYLDDLCHAVGLKGRWSTAYKSFDQACRRSTELDEHSLYLTAYQGRHDPQVLLQHGFQVLAQLFLRFLPRHENHDPIWKELASEERLPMESYFDQLRLHLDDSAWTVRNWLEWIYREFVLGQHEFIALEKLRYQGYDTFKFHYRDGCFHWPFATPDAYREPIRLAGLRIFMALSILIDLGLVCEDPEGNLGLSADGESYWQRILKADNNDH